MMRRPQARRNFHTFIVALTASFAAAASASAQVPRVLVYSGTYGFRHGSIPTANEEIQEIADTGAFTVAFTEDPAAFTPALYADYDVIFWQNATGEIPLTDDQKADYLQFHQCGGGYVGAHASTDANYEWPGYFELVGAWFFQHPHLGYCQGDLATPEFPCEGDANNDIPAFIGGNATLIVEDQVHPATAPWHGSESFRWADEYYLFRDEDGDPLSADPRGYADVHVLVALDELSTMAPAAYPHHQPLAWTKTYGNGRVFYTNLGHNKYTWRAPEFHEQLLGGLAWVTEVRPDPLCVAAIGDPDLDGLRNAADNCSFVANAGQEDAGGVATATPDGIGDACQCGDVTGNGEVNGQDANAIRRHALGLEPNPLFAVPGNCDVTGNGLCNGQDANAVKRAALGQPSPNFGQSCHNATGEPVPSDL